MDSPCLSAREAYSWHEIILSLHLFEWYQRCPCLDPVKIVGPRLHHLPALCKVGSTVVGPAVWVSYGMSKLMLYEIRPHLQDLIKDGPCHGPEAMTGHRVCTVSHAAKCRENGVI